MDSYLSMARRGWMASVLVPLMLTALTAEGAPLRLETLAGGPGQAPHADGPLSSASFFHPTGVAADALGNIYIADSGNHVVRVITSDGQARTIAGQPGTPGDTDGAGSTARFRNPSGVAIDLGGRLLVADTGNCTIRSIDPSGQVTTIAGRAGQCGFNDGNASAAQFAQPSGIETDINGDLYVADRANHVIRRIRDGFVTTHVGTPLEVGSRNGRGLDAQFSQPFSLAIDNIGDLYVADSANHLIRRVTRDRVVTTVCGTVSLTGGSVDGPCQSAMLKRPSGIAVAPDGSLYVADTDNHTIRRITPAGEIETVAGAPGQRGFADGTQFSRLQYPFGVAFAPDGSLLIVETINHAVRRGTVTSVSSATRRRPAGRN